MFVEIIGWIVLGLLAAYVATSRMNRHGEGLALDLGLGITGAVAAGWLFRAYRPASMTGLSLWSVMVVVLGAVVLLAIGRVVRRPAFQG